MSGLPAAGRDGIKALILYPMNALASDQAGRIARSINDDRRLAGLRAGLYIGENGTHSSMGRDHLVDRREALRDDPPDILLTNYKMLDFLLLRREDRNLWACNESDTLRYVVLDEFRTYDGAQGTDVAMLLRRLGATLGMSTADRPLGAAVPVATSATLGSGAGALDELRESAGKVFGVPFDADSVIGETRQSIEAACGPVAVGEVLLAHPLTRAVLAAAGERPSTWAEAVAEVVSRAPNWGVTLMTDPSAVELAMGRYLALLSFARRRHGDAERPLFPIEVQLWVREVSRLLRAVSNVRSCPRSRWGLVASRISGEPELGPIGKA